MPPTPPLSDPDRGPDPIDLLVIGALTVDRFADGSSAPGGAVMHIARAAMSPRRGGARLAVMTTLGSEPEAQAGLAELRGLTAAVWATSAATSATFTHRESSRGRRLWLTSPGGHVQPPRTTGLARAIRAVLYAPVIHEIGLETLEWDGIPQRGAILQGWLRGVDANGEVRVTRLASLAPALVAALGRLDLIVASTEDLAAEGHDPVLQLAALRDGIGAGPTCIVTGGLRGIWIDPGADVAAARLASRNISVPWHLPVPWQVHGAPTVGAGDIFAAFMLLGRWSPAHGRRFLSPRARRAMRVVASILERRRGH